MNEELLLKDYREKLTLTIESVIKVVESIQIKNSQTCDKGDLTLECNYPFYDLFMTYFSLQHRTTKVFASDISSFITPYGEVSLKCNYMASFSNLWFEIY